MHLNPNTIACLKTEPMMHKQVFINHTQKDNNELYFNINFDLISFNLENGLYQY